MTAYFVTATGTDIGKTFVATGILRAARAAGRAAAAIKPIMSGFTGDDLPGSDAGQLLAAMGRPVTLDNIAAICPWRFEAAISPDMAAARENRRIEFNEVVAFCEAAMAAAPELLLVEGAGGVMVPLSATQNLRGLIAALGLPAILVAGTYLGTISHTLTAAEALAARGIRIAVIVLSESPTSPVPPEETATVIRRFLPFSPVRIIPRTNNTAALASLAAFLPSEK